MVWLAVALGGALGSMARHGVNHLIHSASPLTRFPAATFIVNVVGCFVIGVLTGLIVSERLAMPPYWREFVFVGVLGGFTTFSTFGLDTFTLARAGATGAAILNVFGQVALGLLALYVGFIGGRG